MGDRKTLPDLRNQVNSPNHTQALLQKKRDGISFVRRWYAISCHEPGSSAWWDAGTLSNITTWKDERLALGANGSNPFVASLQPGREAKRFSRHTLRKRFRTACKALGEERLTTLTIHHGRHTFISYALAGGRTLAEVRDAAGHSNVTITSRYIHVTVDSGAIGCLF
jgi:integrase